MSDRQFRGIIDRRSSSERSLARGVQAARSRRSRTAAASPAIRAARCACASQSSWSNIMDGSALPALPERLRALKVLRDRLDLLAKVGRLKHLIVHDGIAAAAVPAQMMILGAALGLLDDEPHGPGRSLR